MTRGRKKKKRSIRLRVFTLGAVFLIGSFGVLAFAERLTQEEGLLRIIQAEQVDLNYASTLKVALDAIKKSELTESWGKVLLARRLELAGEKKLALELLQNFSANLEQSGSAATFEAALIVNRLKLELGQKVENFPPYEQIQKQFESFRRRDLEAEGIYTVGLNFLQLKQDKEARLAFLDLRSRFPGSIYSKPARALKELIATKPELPEIELLIREGELKEAEIMLDNYQKQFAPNSAQYFESLLCKETLLRKFKKPIEADELLLSIAADAPESTSSAALFRAAKNSWNENNTLRALELLDQLFERFPKSPLLPDAHYTEARILEELGKLREAERIYEEPIQQLEKITGDNKETLRLVKSVKRAVWLKFARGDFENSIKLSTRILKALSLITSDLDIRYEVTGLTYWMARSYKELNGADNLLKATSLFTTIVQTETRTFYGALSKEILENSNGTKISFFSAPTQNCTILDVGELNSRISVLSSSHLRDLAQHEIDFAFGTMRASSSNLDFPTLLASQSKLSSTHGLVSSEIELAEEGLKLGKRDSKQFACDAELAALAYPTPYLELYQKAKKLTLVTEPLSMAISRSESYFNPEAKSPVGALGLMQLMPDTAKMEGWSGKPELTDPELNISLGVKHIKRLLGDFQGDLFKVAASYNAGSAAVNRWTDRYGSFPSDLYVEFIGYPETNKYVKRVYATRNIYQEILGK